MGRQTALAADHQKTDPKRVGLFVYFGALHQQSAAKLYYQCCLSLRNDGDDHPFISR